MIESTDNPYLPPHDSSIPSKNAKKKEISFLGRWMRWVVICSIASIPSFLLGALVVDGNFAPFVMAIVVVGFALGYASLNVHPACQRMMSNQICKRAAVITICLRLLVSLIFPLGVMNDMGIGVVSVEAAESISGERLGPKRVTKDASDPPPTSPILVLLATTIQGFLLNLELCVVFSVIYGVMHLLPHRGPVHSSE